MSEKDKDSDIQSRWKYRYYETLEELELKEKSAREVERLLRQIISRLTLAADTRHAVLNQQLTELRNAVRDGRDILRMRDLIDTISAQVAELDNMRKRDKKREHPAVNVIDIMEQLIIPDSMTRDFKLLKKKAKKLDNNAEPDAMNAEVIEFMRALMHPPVPEPGEKQTRKDRLLGRILSRKKKPGDEPEQEAGPADQAGADATAEPRVARNKLVAPAVGDLLLQLTLRMPDAVKRRINFPALKRHTNRARARKDLIAIVDVIAQQIEAAYINDDPQPVIMDDESVLALSTALRVFFEQIEPPLDLKERVCELEQYFVDHSDDVESIIHCLNSLAEVVADICQRLSFQRDELEGFFVKLSTRLQDLDAGLQKTAELNQHSDDNNQKLDQAVHSEISNIQESMQSFSDMVSLQQNIQIHLDSIDRHLQEFQDSESERLKDSENHIRALTEKVQKLESEGEQLRSRMQETQKQAYRDVLTGIPNRQAYEERIAEELARCRRYNSKLCMIVWDVDKFKAVNDDYGHAAGDRVLKVVAETLQAHIRETDFLARFGGEEFVLLLPETEREAARQVADKLRSTIEDTPFHFRDSRVPVTISGGIAELQKEENANQLFERADQSLYKAKQNGRNRIEVAD